MNELRKIRCQRCKDFFELPKGLTSGICSACEAERARKIKEIHDLVKENPGITPIHINSITGVPINIIIKIVADGVVEELKMNNYE